MWPPWGRSRSHGPGLAAAGAWPVPWAWFGRPGAWPVPWAWCGRRGGVAGLLGLVCPSRGRGRFPGLRVEAVGAWRNPWASCGRRGGVACPLRLVWRPWVRGGPLRYVFPPWGRGRSPRLRLDAVRAWPVPWSRRGGSPGVAVADLGAWPVKWGSCGRLGGLTGALVLVCPRMRRYGGDPDVRVCTSLGGRRVLLRLCGLHRGPSDPIGRSR